MQSGRSPVLLYMRLIGVLPKLLDLLSITRQIGNTELFQLCLRLLPHRRTGWRMELVILHHQENCFLFPGDSVPQVKPVASEPQRTRAIFSSSRHLKSPARIMSRKTSNVCVTAVPVPWIKLNGISRLESGALCEFRVSKSARPGAPALEDSNDLTTRQGW
jgi:hypothetical protein